jgi:hypothetical protein
MSKESDLYLIVTIAIYGTTNFVVTQNEYEFSSVEALNRAKAHYGSDRFRRNIEAAGAFVKVDVYEVCAPTTK